MEAEVVADVICQLRAANVDLSVACISSSAHTRSHAPASIFMSTPPGEAGALLSIDVSRLSLLAAGLIVRDRLLPHSEILVTSPPAIRTDCVSAVLPSSVPW